MPRIRFFAVSLASLAVLAPALVGAQAADCGALESMDSLVQRFQQVYPTGGPTTRLDGARGRQVMVALDILLGTDSIAFLYSGDGPVTGARGRYLYLALDGADCIHRHDWIDGAVYDKVTRYP